MTADTNTAEGPIPGSPGWTCWQTPLTEIGTLIVVWVPQGITMLGFGDSPEPDALARYAPEVALEDRAELPSCLAELLEPYFLGREVDPAELPVRLHGTEFQRRVWSASRSIPRGVVRTYQGLAKDVSSPRAMRAVGAAMGANPVAIAVPCHRVVAAGYELGGYSGGLERKRRLLKLEGVDVDSGKVRPGQLSLM